MPPAPGIDDARMMSEADTYGSLLFNSQQLRGGGRVNLRKGINDQLIKKIVKENSRKHRQYNNMSRITSSDPALGGGGYEETRHGSNQHNDTQCVRLLKSKAYANP